MEVDGSNSDVHDYFRGVGSFDGAMKALKFLKKFEIDVHARLTIHQINLHDIKRTILFLLEDQGIPKISIDLAEYLGGWCYPFVDIKLKPYEHYYAMITINNLFANYHDRIMLSPSLYAEFHEWKENGEHKSYILNKNQNYNYYYSCQPVFTQLFIRSDGAYIPCSKFHWKILGHIKHDSPIDIWNNHPALLS